MSGYEKDNAGWNDYDCWNENSPPLKVMDFACQSDVRSIFKQIKGGKRKSLIFDMCTRVG